MAIKTIDNPPVKNMTGDSIAKKSTAKHPLPEKPVKNMTKNSTAKHPLPKDYYFHGSKRSQAKNHAYVITKASVKDKSVKICGYNEKGLLVGWGLNHQVVYSRVDNECIAGWFKMMCENDNRVVGEILRNIEEYKLRHSKANSGDSVAKNSTSEDSLAKNIEKKSAENVRKEKG